MNETLRLRQGLWDIAKVCGANIGSSETPAPLISDIVEFAMDAVKELRADYDGLMKEMIG